MSYQVVARKWRPQRFDQVVGQDHITETLKYAILNSRIAPVYLFTGIRGTGKTTLARIMVKSLNCMAPQIDGEPCNKCENCLEIISGKNPDVVEIDGASNNSVDDVRNIKENISYSPIKSKYKVYIIDEIHMLSKSAFNALLKTLEEPPSHTVFILATTDPQKIPATVLSRCQRYDLKRLSLDDVAKQLSKILESEGLGYDMEALYAISREGEGSMRDSQTILEQLITFGEGKITTEEISLILGSSDKKQLRGIVEAIAKKDSVTALSLVSEIFKSGKSVEKAAKDILYLLHHLVLYSELKDHNFLEAPKEEKEWIEKTSALASSSDWIRLFRFWNDQYENIKISDFSLMILEVSVITACTFPSMEDFRNFAKKFSESAINTETAPEPAEIQKKNSEPELKKEIPVEKPVEIVKDYNWRAFTDMLIAKDPFFHGALVNIPYKETGDLISLSPELSMEITKKEITDKLKKLFDDYFQGHRTLEIHIEKEDRQSIYTEAEIKKQKELEDTREEIKNSEAVQTAIQLGFELKKITAK